MVGAMVIVPLAGIASDRQGRRPILLLCSFTMLFASVATALSQAFTMFVLARCLVAGTSGATSILVFIVLYEVTGNEHRALYSILATTISSAWTTPLLSVVALADPGWWLSHAFLATATALAAAWCYSIQESPVWLIDTHRVRRAERVILYAAAENGTDLTKAKATFKAFKTQLEKRDLATPTVSTGTGSSASTFSRRAASVLISWFGVNFAFYGTGLREKTIGTQWAMTAFTLQVVLTIVVYNVITKWGQRNALSMLLALLCLSSGLCVVVHTLNMNFPWTALARLMVDTSASVANGHQLLLHDGDTLTADNHVILDIVMTLLVCASGTAIQWLPEIFVHKKANQSTQPAPNTEQQRKEALKATLDQGTQHIGTKAKTRKSRRRGTQSSASVGVQSPCGTLSPGSARSPTSETVASPSRAKLSKRNKSGVSGGVASPPSQAPISH
ncbi:hypothetical protein MTO96_039474 [Rhipicephalus appendiculatus]